MYYVVFLILYADAFVHSGASTIAFAHARSLAFTQTRYREHESNWKRISK